MEHATTTLAAPGTTGKTIYDDNNAKVLNECKQSSTPYYRCRLCLNREWKRIKKALFTEISSLYSHVLDAHPEVERLGEVCIPVNHAAERFFFFFCVSFYYLFLFTRTTLVIRIFVFSILGSIAPAELLFCDLGNVMLERKLNYLPHMAQVT